MLLPILQPSTIATPRIKGDVIIDQSVVIADGVILNASVGTKIIIHAGVCLGMGTIVTAYEGDVEIKEGVILGSGSLVVGSCSIGTQASLGASVTVYNSDIAPRSVIPAGTLIGDRSRTVELNIDENKDKTEVNSQVKININGNANQNINSENVNSSSQFENPYSKFKISSPPLSSKSDNNLNNQKNQVKNEQVKPNPEIATEINPKVKNELENEVKINSGNNSEKKVEEKTVKNEPKKVDNQTINEDKLTEEEMAEIVNADPWQEEETPNKTVVGKVYINKLLFTLFPDKKS